MDVRVVGINHKSPLAIRERLSISDLSHALQSIQNTVIVSTCNRTEIYTTNTIQETLSWLSEYKNIDVNQFTDSLYIHERQAAQKHLACVASGLDSLIIGETQILGQLKKAYELASRHGLPKDLHKLFQQSFRIAKQVRTKTQIGACPVSVASIGVQAAKGIFGELGNKKALLIGAGETITLAAQHLHKEGVGSIAIANRTIEKAQDLADRFGGEAVTDISDLCNADIVITATSCPVTLVTKAMVEANGKPMVLIDLSVPRDIDDDAKTVKDAVLLTVDELTATAQSNVGKRKQAAVDAEKIIETLINK